MTNTDEKDNEANCCSDRRDGRPWRGNQYELHDAGYVVVVTHSPDNTGAAEWLASMATQGRNFHAYPVDVADCDTFQHCATRIQAEVGPVDILVNNAGVTRDMTFKKMDKVNWDAVVRTNLDSVFNMTGPLWGAGSSIFRRSTVRRAPSVRPTHQARRESGESLFEKGNQASRSATEVHHA